MTTSKEVVALIATNDKYINKIRQQLELHLNIKEELINHLKELELCTNYGRSSKATGIS